MRRELETVAFVLAIALTFAIGSIGFICAFRGSSLAAFSTGEILGMFGGLTGLFFGVFMMIALRRDK